MVLGKNGGQKAKFMGQESFSAKRRTSGGFPAGGREGWMEIKIDIGD